MDSGVAPPTGLFCAHKRLRTSCPECRPPPPPPKPQAPKGARKSRASPGAEPSGPAGSGGEAPRRRTRVKPPTREEAENAEAWWVKKS